MRLLLVEDNAIVAEAIARYLRRAGHAIDCQSDGASAARVLRYQRFDVVVLDIGLPGRSGLDVLGDLRSRGDATPVLMLTAHGEVERRVAALDAGADDYLTKPFDIRELDARCRALARRRRGQASERVRIGGLDLDNAARRVTLEGTVLDLPNREYRLLEILIGRVGQVVAKDEIAHRLFGFDDEAGPNAIELYIARLRKKMGAGARLRIATVRGVGYRAEVTCEP